MLFTLIYFWIWFTSVSWAIINAQVMELLSPLVDEGWNRLNWRKLVGACLECPNVMLLLAYADGMLMSLNHYNCLVWVSNWDNCAICFGLNQVYCHQVRSAWHIWWVINLCLVVTDSIPIVNDLYLMIMITFNSLRLSDPYVLQWTWE